MTVTFTGLVDQRVIIFSPTFQKQFDTFKKKLFASMWC